MFNSTTRAVHVEHLRDLLAEKQDEARRLHSEYHQVASSAQPATERTAAVAAPVPDPRLKSDTAYLRALIDRKRTEDVRILLRGKPYLLDEYVRLGPDQTALEYAMDQGQDQGIQDVIAVLREVAIESAEDPQPS